VRLQPAGNGDYVISGNRPSPHCRRVYHDNWSPSNLITMPVLRHAGSSAGRTLGFASQNVRSLTLLKFDALLVEFLDRSLDIVVLCETWHDSDSVSIRRLRADGFSVVEHARPRRVPNSLGTNHGDVAVVAAAGVRLTPVIIGHQPTTFECVAARVQSGASSCVVIVVYRPGQRLLLPRSLRKWQTCSMDW